MKECPKCKQTKSLSLFHKNKNRKDGMQRICKDCCKERDQKFYIENKHKARKQNSKQYKRNKEFVTRWKKIFGRCIDCGITDYRVLEFDHIKDKSNNVSNLMTGRSIKIIKEEIRKCECRCANCHRIKTAERRNKTNK